MPNAFVDTNVFLYCFDTGDEQRRRRAQELLLELGNDLAISTQVLQEFYWNALKKLKLSLSDAKSATQLMTQRRVIELSANLVVSAIETSESYRISFWDSLILEAAASADCKVLYTEDLNTGQKIRGVRVVNPFDGLEGGPTVSG